MYRGEGAESGRNRFEKCLPAGTGTKIYFSSQSSIASVQRTATLASRSAVPCGANTTPTNANRAIEIAMQRTQGLRGPNSVFLGGDMTANER